MIENLSPGGGGGGLESVVAGTGISVDNTNPDNPIITNTSPGGTTYALTLADAENTTSEVVIASFVIPANTLSINEYVVLEYAWHMSCFAAATLTTRIKFVNDGTTTTHSTTSPSIGAGGVARGMTVQPIGRTASTTIHTLSAGQNKTYDVTAGPNHFSNQNYFLWGTWTNATLDFTKDIQCQITVQFSVAGSANHLRTFNGRAYKPQGLAV
jgi:hypothetical protein